MKKTKYAYQIQSCRDAEGGSFVVRRVEVVAVYPLTKTAGIKAFINGREVFGFAPFSELCSKERKALEVVMRRIREIPSGDEIAARVEVAQDRRRSIRDGSTNWRKTAVAA